MSTSMIPPGAPTDGATADHRRDSLASRAWLALALVPVAFGVAMIVGEVLYAAAGYPDGQDAPFGLALLIDGAATLLAMVPGGAAVLYGRRAAREGARSAVVAVILGSLSLVFWAGMFLANEIGLLLR